MGFNTGEVLQQVAIACSIRIRGPQNLDGQERPRAFPSRLPAADVSVCQCMNLTVRIKRCRCIRQASQVCGGPEGGTSVLGS